jgi:hypothetical protein
MNRESLKYIGLGLIAVVLVFANTMMVYKTFFAKNRLNPDYKNPVKVTNEDIRRYADSVFVHRDSLWIVEDDIMSNKRIIMENGDTLGYVFIVYEPIPCPSCSNLNYMLFTDKEYKLKDIILLRDVIEDYKVIEKEQVSTVVKPFTGINLLLNEDDIQISIDKPKKFITAFKESVYELQRKVRLFNEH